MFPQTQRTREARGFALIVTLSLMILLTVIAVGLLSLSSISLRSSASSSNTSMAQANARMALMLAIGELQKQIGPDQRVTAEAAILAKGTQTIAQPHWVGVWNSAGTNTASTPLASAPKWLVSSSPSAASPDPANPPSDLFIIAKDLGASTGVAVPRVSVVSKSATGSTSTASTGRYAYWVADEGVKARVNVTPPTNPALASLENGERMARSMVSQQPAMTQAGNEWTNTTTDQQTKILSLSSCSLVTTGTTTDVPKKYQHDLTADGYGLPIDVSAGGFKKDLTTIFDNSALVSKYLGATLDPAAPAGRSPFTVADAAKFYLVDDYSANNAGPNWGILYNYNNLWRANTDSMAVYGPNPSNSNLRTRDWAPYTKSDTIYVGEHYIDTQQQFSKIGPVWSVFRLGFRLSSFSSGGKYQLRLHVKPIIGLWNPYNVKLQANTYTMIWAACSYLKLKIKEPGGTIREPKLWLRELAPIGTTSLLVPQNRFQMDIQNIGFEPGEFRSFSVDSSTPLGLTGNLLVPKLNGKEAFYKNLPWGTGTNVPPSGSKSTGPMLVPAGSEVTIEEIFLDDLQTPETKIRFPGIQDKDTSSFFNIRTSSGDLCRFSDMWVLADGSGGSGEVPEKFEGIFPTKTVEYLAANITEPDASWEIRLRTSDQTERPLRNFVDSEPRAIVMNPRWDGSTASNGWWFSAPYAGGGTNRRGLVLDPAFQSTTGGNFNHFGGNSSDASGKTHVALYDVPRAPLASLAQFQHAQLSRYNFEPSFVVGNSHASMRIQPEKTSVPNYNGITNFTLVDSSYKINRKLWDSYFLSTVSGSFKGGTTTADSAYPLDTVKYTQSLPNSRFMVLPLAGDKTFAGITGKSSYPAEAIASRIAVLGAFNINSTSKIAWKTLLASLAGREFPTVNATGLTWGSGADTRFSHFASLLSATGSKTDATDDAFWLSFRKLDDTELDALAGAIVQEVTTRGPFRSLAEFINRNPNASSIDQQRKGALQSALDKVLNGPLQGAGDLKAIPGMNNDAFDPYTEKQAAGNAGYISQADVLQTIGPVIQARSDCFRIRAMGQVLSPDGTRVVAQAVCEACIQRQASYLDSTDAAELPANDPNNPAVANPAISPINQLFGRSLTVISFRWLQQSEI